MKNKISSAEQIDIEVNSDGLDLMKHYLSDHNSGSNVGGVLVITLSFNGTYDILPSQSAYPGQKVTTSLGGAGHAIAIVGYCDDIKYDFNGDGLFTNNIDLNGDNVIDIRDWEIGGLKLVNSYGLGNGNDGFWWLPYRFLADKHSYAIDVVENNPQIVLRTEIQHEIRRFLNIGSGSTMLANEPPPSIGQFVGYEFLKLKGGNYPMKGNLYPDATLDYDPIEMELDFSGIHQGADIGKVYLLIFCQSITPPGTLKKFSLVDYRWNEEFELKYDQENIPIAQGIQYYGIEYDLIPHESPISSNITFEANMVSRFKPTLTGNSTMTVEDGVRIDMYNSEIIIEPGSTLALGNNVTIKGKRGVNRITIRGNAQFGTNVSFIAEEGAHLFIDFDNDNLSTTINTAYFERTNLNVSCQSLTLVGCSVLSDENNRICVKRGGALFNNNSLFSNFGDKMWRGIEVWGNSNVSQLPINNQGLVKIINGGTIENAECGIRTYKPYALPDGSETLDPDKSYFGGIVMAEGAVFNNNKTAVEIMPYEYQNYSYFKNCTFETNAALLDGSSPEYFVKMSSVSGIYFSGCEFTNTYTGYTNVNERGGGIFASDADVIVDHLCLGGTTPCNDFKNCSFTGLYRGIYALGAEKQRTVRIQNSDFSNIVKGVYLSSLDFAEVNLNNFQVWNEVVSLNPIGCSTYIDASTGFTIEENRFVNTETSRRGIGLIINESGADNNQVYNNYFEKLNFATIAQGYNNAGLTGTSGLCYKCNDFVNNDNDIRISRRNSNILSAQDGIAYAQGKNEPGNNLAPAGNTFTTVVNSKDISNSCNWIVYFRHNYGPTSLLPTPADLTTNYQVFATTYTKSVSCPSHLGTGTEKSEVIAALASATIGAETTQSTLDAVIDGGSTPELQSDVITSIPEEGMELRDQLLTESPFLSETVMQSSINKEDVLNNAMLRDVMVANPQSAKSAQIVEMLDERVSPLTDELKNEILAGQTILGDKENLEAELSFWKQEAWFNFSTLCRLYANDTLHTWSSDTIGVLLASETTLESRYKLAFWHWFKGDATSATQVLSSIPVAFTLDASGLAQHERYSLLLNTLIQIKTDPEAVLEAGTDIASTLNQLSTQSEDKPAAMSRNLLLSAGLISYEEPIKLDDGLKTMPIYKPETVSAKSSKLAVYPSPANTFVTVAWNTPEQNNVLLSIYDAGGRIVLQQKLQGKNNETILDITGFVNGTYRVSLSNGNKTIATETLVIIK